MVMRNLIPHTQFEGRIDILGDNTDANSALPRSAVESLITSAVTGAALSVAPESVGKLSITGTQIKLEKAAIAEVVINGGGAGAGEASLAAYLAGSPAVMESGDVLVLLDATGGKQLWLATATPASAEAEFIQIDEIDAGNAAQVRALLSGSSGITYNVSTGAFTLDSAFVRGLFSGATGVVYDSGTGGLSLDGAYVKSLISASGGLLTYTDGAIALTEAAIEGLFSGTGPIVYDGAGGFSLSDLVYADLDVALQGLIDSKATRVDVAGVSMTGGTAVTVTHNLGVSKVFVQGFDGTAHVWMEVDCDNANSCQITSASTGTFDFVILG